MALSTMFTFLMVDNGSGVYEKLVDIVDYPDIGGQSEMIDVTTLTSRAKEYTLGIQNSESAKYEVFYDKEIYQKLEAIRNKEKKFAIWFGGDDTGEEVKPTGSDGKFEFLGKLDFYVKGGAVNSPRKIGLSIAILKTYTFK